MAAWGVILFFSAKSALAVVPEIRALKVGSDVKIDIVTPGTPTYDYVKSTHPTLSIRPVFLATGTTSVSQLDTGAVSDGRSLVFYAVADANKPSISITNPADGFSTTSAKILVDGTQTGAAVVYVKGLATSLGAGTFTTSPSSTPTVPLVDGPNTVYAMAMTPTGEFAEDQSSGTRNSPDQAPSLEIDVSLPGTVYTTRPSLVVNYSDPDGSSPPYGLDTTTLKVFVNGDEWTNKAGATTGALSWTYTVIPADGLQPGTNFVYATIRDSYGYAVVAARAFVIKEPELTLLSSTQVNAGDTLTISGNGFSSVASENTVSVNGVTTTPASAGPTSLTLTVPSTATSGPVTVAVDGMTSNALSLTVNQITGLLDIKSLAVAASASDHTFFTDISAANVGLWEITSPGNKTRRTSSGSPIGLGKNAADELYYGVGNDASATGRVTKYNPVTFATTVVGDTKVSGAPDNETNASVYGTAVDASGNTYTADHRNSKIKKIASGVPSTIQSSLPAAVNLPTGLAANNTTNKLYFTNGDDIDRIDIPAGGNLAAVASGLGTPLGLDILSSGIDPKFLGALVVARNTANKVSVILLGATPAQNIVYDLGTGISGVRAVAVKTDITGASAFVAVSNATQVFNLPRPSLELKALDGSGNPLPVTQFPTKLYADFDRTTGLDTENVQFLDFEVRVTPVSLIPDADSDALIEWSFEDPDDPSGNTAIDSSPAGNDNNGSLDAPSHWEQLGAYTLVDNLSTATTALRSGLSRVRFHLTDKPGDNFILRATLKKVPIFDQLSVSSSIFTAWKKLHIETDRMSDANGYYDATDADDADLASADMSVVTTLFAPVLLPAYVEPWFDTGQETTNVPFKGKVDAGDSNDIINTCAQYRGTPANHSGYWAAYVLGAYEASDNATYHFGDNDPDGEQVPAGQSTTYPIGITNLDSTCGADQEFYSLVYNEEIRDRASFVGFDPRYVTEVTPVHEVGHQFKLIDLPTTDGSGGIMEIVTPQKVPVLRPADIKSVRTITYPHCGL